MMRSSSSAVQAIAPPATEGAPHASAAFAAVAGAPVRGGAPSGADAGGAAELCAVFGTDAAEGLLRSSLPPEARSLPLHTPIHSSCRLFQPL